jgi:hypothetical protein
MEPKQRRFSVGYTIGTIIALLLIQSYLFAPHPETLAYSDFIRLLKAGKVSDLTLSNQTIWGTLAANWMLTIRWFYAIRDSPSLKRGREPDRSDASRGRNANAGHEGAHMTRALVIGAATLIGSRLSKALMPALLEPSEGLPRGQRSQSSDVESDTVLSVTIPPQQTKCKHSTPPKVSRKAGLARRMPSGCTSITGPACGEA